MDDKKYLLNIKNFKKLGLIEIGGYGEVSKAQEISTGKLYAAKTARNENPENKLRIEDFLKQVSILSNLSHRAIVKHYGISEKDFYNESHPVLFTEFMPNGSLINIIKKEKQGKSPEGWTFTKKLINIYGIASAMRLLHSHQILHRDLKPANVLLDDNFYPKICDFDTHIKEADVLNGDMMVGTPAYMAPELYDEDTEKSFPLDVFAFGLTVYTIVMGKEPDFGGLMSPFMFAKKILDGQRPKIDVEIPVSYRKLIEDCWAQNQFERPTFDEIVSRLKTDRGFITNEVDEEEYLHYIRYVETREDEQKEEEEEETKQEVKEEIEIVEIIHNPFSIDVKNLNLKNFEKQYKVGYGFSSDVYKIKGKTNEIFYAAKIFNQEIFDENRSTRMAKNLLREVNILSELSHPSIMKFYGYSSTDFGNFCRPVIITEYLSNGSLEDMIEMERSGFKAGFWNSTIKLINIYGIAKSMSYLHSKNIIHRDLKPVNILSDEFLFPKLADFGFSKHLGDQQILIEDGVVLKQSGIMGTPAFIAPEIWEKALYSKPGDVYAFGILVYEIVTLEIPFYGLNNNQVSYSVVSKKNRPKFNESIPKHYKELIKKCWSHDPNDRPTFDNILTKLETDPRFTADIDKQLFFNYINFIKEQEQKNSSKNNKYSFQKYTLEGMHREIKENKSELIIDGLVNIESYFNKSEIYRNDFSIFYEVSNKETGELFSAKISNIKVGEMRENEKQSLAREIGILTKLKHPTIQRVIGYSFYDFEHQLNPVVICEPTSHHTLYEIISNEWQRKKNDKWTSTKKLINIYGIASGMSYLHSHDVIHHELNTQNIFVDSELNPKITEFGFMIKPQNSCRISHHSMINKSRIQYYIAPEVIQCNDVLNEEQNNNNKRNIDIDKASDVYSFAYVVYEIITGKIPFLNIKDQNQFFNEIINKISRPSLSGIPSKYRELISKCWSPDPKERPTFKTIVENLRTDNEFITNTINEKEYHNYIIMLEQNEQK